MSRAEAAMLGNRRVGCQAGRPGPRAIEKIGEIDRGEEPVGDHRPIEGGDELDSVTVGRSTGGRVDRAVVGRRNEGHTDRMGFARHGVPAELEQGVIEDELVGVGEVRHAGDAVVGKGNPWGDPEFRRQGVFEVRRRRQDAEITGLLADTADGLDLALRLKRHADVRALAEAEHVLGIDVGGAHAGNG
jgi:hypothetical protein